MRTKRLLLRLRRLSLNKIFVSNGEFKHTNNKVIITLYMFNRQKRSYLNKMRKFRFFNYFSAEIKKNIAKLIIRKTKLKILKTCLEKLYNKNVEFNLVNIKRFYINSDILSETITLKLTRNRKKILRYLKNMRKKIKVNKKKYLFIEPKQDKIFKENLVAIKKDFLADSLTKKRIVFFGLKYKDITGFRLEARGRLTRRYTASRSVTKFRYKGNLLNIDSSHRGLSTVLLKGNLRSNLQYTKLKSKTRIGSFGIKG